MPSALSEIEEAISRDVLGEPTYARFSRHHPKCDLGTDIAAFLHLARRWMGPVKSLQARGQWIGEGGCLSLIASHEKGAISAIDLSSSAVRPDWSEIEIHIRIEGPKGTAELFGGGALRFSGAGWRRDYQTGCPDLPEASDPETQALVERAMRAAESGEMA